MDLVKFAAAAALAVAPLAANAENIVATTPASVAKFFEDEGAGVEALTDNVGDPKLNIEYYGNEFTVYYYGCDNNTNCDAVQFFSGYQTDGGVRLAKINQWNAENRFTRAYVSEEGAARIEMDVFMGKDGVSADDFARMTGIWARSMNDFEEVIGW
ncbi:YbjN domain-containing protein [Roseobacteraceae bacterium NS-SX3]